MKKVVYISSYVPERCGIATFAKDTIDAIAKMSAIKQEIVAMVRPGGIEKYGNEVKYKIHRDSLDEYFEVVKYINSSGADLVVLEHEFGLFGGKKGSYVFNLIKGIKCPTVSVCHTVVGFEEGDAVEILKKVVDLSAAVVLISELSKRRLEEVRIPTNKVVVIPHGVPDLEFEETEKYKKLMKVEKSLIMGNINLLTNNRGIEYVIEAIPEIAKLYPDLLYLIIGQTHPGELKTDGESYRDFLKSKVAKLGIQNNVKFVNSYVSFEELLDWLRVMDIYITPYTDRQQASSGALAYAVGAGRYCISTPYPYANELLASKRGIIVPFADSPAIAMAVKQWSNPKNRDLYRRNAYNFGRSMIWSEVAKKYFELFTRIVKNC